MAIKQHKPTTPARRQQTVAAFDELTASSPHKPLTKGLKRIGGRNNQGRITIWYRGGGHKRRYRMIDFRRDKIGVPAKVATIEYDPEPLGAHRAAALRRRREALHPGADGPGGGRPGGVRARGADQPGQRAAAAGDPARHDRPQHRAQDRQGRPDGAQRRRRRPADGEGGRLRPAAAALGRDAPGARRVLARRSARSATSSTRTDLARQGRPQALAGPAAARPRRRDEPGRPPAWAAARAAPRAVVTRCTPWGVPTKGYKTRNNKRTDTMIVRRRKKK